MTESTLAYFEPKSNVLSALNVKNYKVLLVGVGLSALNVVAPNALFNVLLTLCLASLGADLGIVYIFLKELSSLGFFSKIVQNSAATSLHLYFSQKQW